MISPPTVFGDGTTGCTAHPYGLFGRFCLPVHIEGSRADTLFQWSEPLAHRVARGLPTVVDAVVQIVPPVVRNLDLFVFEVRVPVQCAVDDRFGHGVVGVPDVVEVQVLTPRTAALPHQPGYQRLLLRFRQFLRCLLALAGRGHIRRLLVRCGGLREQSPRGG